MNQREYCKLYVQKLLKTNTILTNIFERISKTVQWRTRKNGCAEQQFNECVQCICPSSLVCKYRNEDRVLSASPANAKSSYLLRLARATLYDDLACRHRGNININPCPLATIRSEVAAINEQRRQIEICIHIGVDYERFLAPCASSVHPISEVTKYSRWSASYGVPKGVVWCSNLIVGNRGQWDNIPSTEGLAKCTTILLLLSPSVVVSLIWRFFNASSLLKDCSRSQAVTYSKQVVLTQERCVI